MRGFVAVPKIDADRSARQAASRRETTTCDRRRPFGAEDLSQLWLMMAMIGGIFPPNFQPW
jgi:hypothetical protein